MSLRIDKGEPLQMVEVITDGPRRRRAGQARNDVPQRHLPAAADHLQDFTLPVGEIMGNAVRGDVAARQEAHPDGARLLTELGFRMTRPDALRYDLLRATAPLFDEAAPVEDARDERIAWS